MARGSDKHSPRIDDNLGHDTRYTEAVWESLGGRVEHRL